MTHDKDDYSPTTVIDATQPAYDDGKEILAPMSRPTLPGVRR